MMKKGHANKEVCYVRAQLHHRKFYSAQVGQSFFKSMDIEVVHDLPGVGENLQDHWKCIYNINVTTCFTLPCFKMV
jgi:choline dehydrogenase